MRKNYFIRKAKRNGYKQLDLYFRSVNLLYNAFEREKQIVENEREILKFIQGMNINEVNEMFIIINDRCEELNITENLSYSFLFKLTVIQYVLYLMRLDNDFDTARETL